MSAFAGIFYWDGQPAEPAVVRAMLRPLERRGPHGCRTWTQGGAGLGHAQLHATPESLIERQPYVDFSNRWAIAADVRLDNRTELLADLGEPETSTTDPELILAAYLHWGTACAERLLGDFVFVIWDRDAQTVFGARDHMGVRPFYYRQQLGRLFACGSDPAAILAAPEIQRVINESRLADYLAPVLEGSDKTSTFYRDIFHLPPAHTITVTPNGARIREYWSPDPKRELRLGRDDDYSEAFGEVFADAVRCRLRSARPAAAMLSGGLDSSAVVGFARNGRTPVSGVGGLRTYSALLRDTANCCETPFVKAMVESGGLDARYVYDDQLAPLGPLVDDHFNAGSDLFDFADIPLIAYHAAESDGVHVVLDGVDGDVVAAANALYLIEYARAGPGRRFLSAASGYANYYGFSRRQAAGLFWHQGLKPLMKARISPRLREMWRSRNGQHWDGRNIPWGDPMVRDSLIDHEFAQRIGLAEKLVTLTGDTRWDERSFRENDALTLNAPFLTAALERYDRIAASRSIEARHPFFDKRVVEFCLALPLAIKQSDGWAKMIVRRALTGLVPDQVRWRRHSQANLNHHFFVRLMSPHRDRMVEMVRLGLKEIAPYVNHASLSDAFAERSVAASQPESLWKIYQALRLLLWLRRN